MGSGQRMLVDVDFENIENPELWSPAQPNMYSVNTGIYDIKTGEKLDEVISPLGFRWFSFDADKGFMPVSYTHLIYRRRGLFKTGREYCRFLPLAREYARRRNPLLGYEDAFS